MGQVVSVELASRTAGAFVLRTPQPGAVGHVVISDGKGGTVEAHSSKDGVIASALSRRRWDTGIFAPAVQYTPGSAVPLADPVGMIYRLTTPLMTGEKIKEMQCKLQAAGFDTGGLDGVFGPHTHAAVLAFQLASGLAGDGEVGRLTARALRINMHAPTRSSPGRTSGKRRL
jgi:hypothetical protein